jgi:hypothetical protein
MTTKIKPVLGWREWVALPEFGITRIKAKVDTGARTSALHAFNLQTFEQGGERMVRFRLHPVQHRTDQVVECVARVVDERDVTDSGGHTEKRLVIRTIVQIGDDKRRIEVTLTDRDNMLFRLLLGRTAVRPTYVIDPNKSFLLDK